MNRASLSCGTTSKQEFQEKGMELEIIFGELTENFPNLTITIKLQIKETQQNSSNKKRNQNRTHYDKIAQDQ